MKPKNRKKGDSMVIPTTPTKTPYTDRLFSGVHLLQHSGFNTDKPNYLESINDWKKILNIQEQKNITLALRFSELEYSRIRLIEEKALIILSKTKESIRNKFIDIANLGIPVTEVMVKKETKLAGAFPYSPRTSKTSTTTVPNTSSENIFSTAISKPISKPIRTRETILQSALQKIVDLAEERIQLKTEIETLQEEVLNYMTKFNQLTYENQVKDLEIEDLKKNQQLNTDTLTSEEEALMDKLSLLGAGI